MSVHKKNGAGEKREARKSGLPHFSFLGWHFISFLKIASFLKIKGLYFPNSVRAEMVRLANFSIASP